MAIPAFWRINEWVKAANGYAMANGQVFFCTQPSNTTSYPPTPLATLYADPFGLTPISQPLVCDGYGYVSAYVAAGTYTMVVALSNVIQNVYPDQSYGISSAQVLFETNGVPNPNQGALNIVGTGDISVTLNTLGQTVVESTGVVLPGTGTGPLLVTAFAGVSTAPNGDILTADGFGNAQDSGVLLSSLALLNAPTFTGNVIASGNLSVTGQLTNLLGTSTLTTANITTANVTNLNSILNAADFPGADIGVKINNAIAALAGNAGDILIPAGSYLFSNKIVCPMGANLVGVGLGATSLTWTLNTGCAIVFGGSGSASGSHKNFSLLYGGSGTNTATGMYFGGDPTNALSPSTNTYAYATMRDVQVNGFKNNLRLGNNCFTNGWEGCIITSARNANVSIDPSVTNSGENINFIGCYILGAKNATGTTYAFYTPSGFTEVGMTWRLTNCSIDYHGINGATGTTAPMQGGFKSVSCHFEQFSGVFFDTTNDGRVVDEGSYFVLTASSGNTEAFGIIGNSTNCLFTGTYFWIASGQTLTALMNQPSTGQYTTVECQGTGVVPIFSPATVIYSVAVANQGGAITGAGIFTPTITNQYRISWHAKVTTAASSSSTLGGSIGFQPIYTDGFDSTAGTYQTIVTTNAGNSLTSAVSGQCIINAKAGGVVTYNFGYASSGATPMQYYLLVNVERL